MNATSVRCKTAAPFSRKSKSPASIPTWAAKPPGTTWLIRTPAADSSIVAPRLLRNEKCRAPRTPVSRYNTRSAIILVPAPGRVLGVVAPVFGFAEPIAYDRDPRTGCHLLEGDRRLVVSLAPGVALGPREATLGVHGADLDLRGVELVDMGIVHPRFALIRIG